MSDLEATRASSSELVLVFVGYARVLLKASVNQLDARKQYRVIGRSSVEPGGGIKTKPNEYQGITN